MQDPVALESRRGRIGSQVVWPVQWPAKSSVAELRPKPDSVLRHMSVPQLMDVKQRPPSLFSLKSFI